MFALVDGNNFYVSCERVFRPDLRRKPVVVLTNNDQMIISRSNEVKRLGIKMGESVHNILPLIRQHNITMFSSNYELYGDMSARMVSIMREYVRDIEVYSIDEAFLSLHGYKYKNLKEYGITITNAVTLGTGLPVSMGIAPTKTLAKIANRFAKKYPKYNNVCLIDTDDKRIKALKLTDISDVWGVGHASAEKLRKRGVTTAYDFTQLSQKWVRKNLSVTGERTYKELQGTACIELELLPPDKQQICTSRIFGKPVNDFGLLRESVATYASICCERLRKQRCCAASIMVFTCVRSGIYGKDWHEVAQNSAITLPTPTNSTLEIVRGATEAVRQLYSPGYQYTKAGIILTQLVPDSSVQLSLLDTSDQAKHAKLMEVMDKYNSGFIRSRIRLAAQGTANTKWKLKQELLSPCYTTRISDVLKVH